MESNAPYEPWARNLLDSIRLTFRPYIQPLQPPKLMTRVLEEIHKRHNEVIPRKPEPYNLELLRLKLASVWKKRKTLKGLSRKDLRRAPWVLFDREKPLGRIEGLARDYLVWLSEHASAFTIRTILMVFLMHYPETLPTFELWRKELRRILGENSTPSLSKWRECCQEFCLLEPKGYIGFGAKYKASGMRAEDFLTRAGFTGELAKSRFLSRALLHVLIGLENDLRNGKVTSTHLARSLDFLMENEIEPRFAEHRKEIIERLLSPFATAVRAEQAQTLNEIARFLIKTFGDPRLPLAAKWHGVSSSAKQVIMRWLTGITLEDFFRILDHTVQGGNYSHHWPYRRAFWSAYFKKGHLTEAWVLLGPYAQQYVKRIKDWEFKAHGQLLKGYNVLSNHSVLLLKFKGGLVLAEWSHSGKGRFWLPGNKKAPKFYKPEYSRRELIDNCDYEFIHSNSAKYGWQRKIADWIRDQTGIYVRETEYKVG